MNKTTLNSQEEKYSMLSLRRATFVGLAAHRLRNISIHALLAESDLYTLTRCASHRLFLSTLSLRRATPGESGQRRWLDISIHALLAESDHSRRSRKQRHPNFYPRSPCGERPSNADTKTPHFTFLSTLSLRRATQSEHCERLKSEISIHALLAESDELEPSKTRRLTFLSTLSLRRATYQRQHTIHPHQISIHALLAESDSKSAQNSGALLRI